jgi:hypothetical protein
MEANLGSAAAPLKRETLQGWKRRNSVGEARAAGFVGSRATTREGVFAPGSPSSERRSASLSSKIGFSDAVLRTEWVGAATPASTAWRNRFAALWHHQIYGGTYEIQREIISKSLACSPGWSRADAHHWAGDVSAIGVLSDKPVVGERREQSVCGGIRCAELLLPPPSVEGRPGPG